MGLSGFLQYAVGVVSCGSKPGSDVVVDWLLGFRCGCCMRRTAILLVLSTWWRRRGLGRRRRHSGYTLDCNVLRILHINSGVAVRVGDTLVSRHGLKAFWSSSRHISLIRHDCTPIDISTLILSWKRFSFGIPKELPCYQR